MLKELLDPNALWAQILLELVGELANTSADGVAQKYEDDAVALVRSKGLTKAADIVDATLDMVEDKQNWSSIAVRLFLGLRGTTRAEEKAKFAAAALAAPAAAAAAPAVVAVAPAVVAVAPAAAVVWAVAAWAALEVLPMAVRSPTSRRARPSL